VSSEGEHWVRTTKHKEAHVTEASPSAAAVTEISPAEHDSQVAADLQATAEASLADAFDRTSALLHSNPLYRSILFRILTCCDGTRRALPELEERIATYPEFAQSVHPQYFLIMWLVESGALDMFEMDDEGKVLTDERKAGRSVDEIDDLVAGWSFETNETGRRVIEDFSPKHRLIELLDIVPERYETYVELLEFLQTKRAFAEVDALLRGREILMSGRDADDRPMQPSVFVDKLAACGGITFNDGWMITQEGKELLDTIRT
jgi:hypothetical protein